MSKGKKPETEVPDPPVAAEVAPPIPDPPAVEGPAPTAPRRR